MNHKQLPIETDNFNKPISEGYSYIDKTLFIKELLDKEGESNLLARPRSFGKNLNMSIFRCFFENTGKEVINAENRELFDGLKF